MRLGIGILTLLTALLATACGGRAGDNLCVPPRPAVEVIEPLSAKVHSPEVLLTVRGSNFIPRSVVFFDGHALSTTFISAQQVRAIVPLDYLHRVGPVAVDVFNPRDTFACSYGQSQSSNSVTFTIVP